MLGIIIIYWDQPADHEPSPYTNLNSMQKQLSIHHHQGKSQQAKMSMIASLKKPYLSKTQWETLRITPKDSAHPFVSPRAGNIVIDFVNKLDYLEELHFVFKMHVNNLYQPWTTILTMINQCLIGKTFGSDKPRHPPIHQVDHLLLGGRHNIYKRPQSPVHITTDGYPPNNLKFVNKGEVDEVFRISIPKNLITDGIWNSNYYKKYLDMAARKTRQPTTMSGEEKIRKGKRSDHLVDEKDEESKPASEPRMEDDEYSLQRGIQMSLESLQAQDVEGKRKGIISDKQATQSLLDLQKQKKQSIKDKYIFQRWTLVTHDASIGPSAQPQNDTSANMVHDTSSPTYSTNDVETVAGMEQSTSKADNEILNVDEEHDEEVSNTMVLEERNVELDEG
nr:hypothetical protein [Tanacetum cinerariifolium]